MLSKDTTPELTETHSHHLNPTTPTARTAPASPAASASAERKLVERAQQGDEQAFAQIYDAYRRRVYSLCLRMTGNPAEAEDLAQEAFLRLFRKISSFRGESAFSTWLYRLVANVVLMHLRKKRLPALSFDDTSSHGDDPAPPHEFGVDDRRLEGTTDRLKLERAIGRLPKGYRAVFILHDIEGYEHAEIARLLDCTSGNSKSQLHKARRRLRQWLNADTPVRRAPKASLDGAWQPSIAAH